MDNPVTQPNAGEATFPVAAIVCIAIGGYVVLIVIVIIIRQVLLQRGMCRENCNWCGKEGEPCCECCLSCAESANCCKSPNISACLDSICPARKQLSCTDIILCECCSNQDGGCCGSEEPLCDCGNFNCTPQCSLPECDSINCLCFSLQLKGPHPDDTDDD